MLEDKIELAICHKIQRVAGLESKSKDWSPVVVRHGEVSKIAEHPGILNDRGSTLRAEDQSSVGLRGEARSATRSTRREEERGGNSLEEA